MNQERFMDFLRRHKWSILCTGLGIVFTILLFTINFWRTLLLFVITGISLVIGMLLDKGGIDSVKDFFEKLLPKIK